MTKSSESNIECVVSKYFSDYKKILEVQNSTKDLTLKNILQLSLNYLHTKMYKSDEYLDSIASKNIEDIIPQDLIDLIYYICNPLYDMYSYAVDVTGKDDYILICDKGRGLFNSIKITKDGFSKEAEIYKDNKTVVNHILDVDADNYDNIIDIRIGIFNKDERLSIIKRVINDYKILKLNDDNILLRKYLDNTVLDFDDTWNNFLDRLIKDTEFDIIKNIKFNHLDMSDYHNNLLKSYKSINKFNI